jgi:hypothetical protein
MIVRGMQVEEADFGDWGHTNATDDTSPTTTAARTRPQQCRGDVDGNHRWCPGMVPEPAGAESLADGAYGTASRRGTRCSPTRSRAANGPAPLGSAADGWSSVSATVAAAGRRWGSVAGVDHDRRLRGWGHGGDGVAYHLATGHVVAVGGQVGQADGADAVGLGVADAARWRRPAALTPPRSSTCAW